ncbi:Ubiquitin [uncultured virus]|nr:Ubiquitin [uncultured virus]
MKILVQTLQQEKFEIEVDDNSTILDLKNIISTKKKEIPFDHIKLIFEGKIMENEKSLEFYSLKNQSRIVLLVTKPKTKQPVENPPQIAQPNLSINIPNIGSSVNNPTLSQNISSNIPNLSLNNFVQNLSTTEFNPQLFLQLLMQNPMVSSFAQQNPQDFEQILNNPNFLQNVLNSGNLFNGQNFGSTMEGEMVIELTQQEKLDVEELVSLGFEESEVLQFYIACGKDKTSTADMLFNQLTPIQN